jgi:predicted Holliday junction resolvase-like endonuclease
MAISLWSIRHEHVVKAKLMRKRGWLQEKLRACRRDAIRNSKNHSEKLIRDDITFAYRHEYTL